MITKKLNISGHVQGVAYRAWMVQRATQLSVWGWVRNCADGSVEALVHGPEELVEELVIDCNLGPGLATIEKIDITDAEYDGSVGFAMKPSTS